MRPDGTRVKNLPPIVAAVPYIMPKRYDAQNSITENIDEEVIKAYIREKRRGASASTTWPSSSPRTTRRCRQIPS